MHLRLPTTVLALAVCASLAAPATAWARDQDRSGWRDGAWHDGPGERDAPPLNDPRGYDEGAQRGREEWRHAPQARYDAPGRDAWLADCRQRVSSRDRGVGGAVIGGVVGGVAGNRIAGRGNRAVGTVAGAAVGAVAGAAIDRAEDRGRVRDECEAYLDDYYARYEAGYGAPGGYSGYASYPAYAAAPGYAYSGCCMAAPVAMVPVRAEPECTETVEYVYEDVPVRSRPARIKRTKIVPDKRVKVVPDKRIYTK